MLAKFAPTSSLQTPEAVQHFNCNLKSFYRKIDLELWKFKKCALDFIFGIIFFIVVKRMTLK